MSEAPRTVEGWYALHDVRRLDWPRWKALPGQERAEIAAEASEALAGWQSVTDAAEGSSALYRVIGHKGDLMMVHFRPTAADLHALEMAFNATRLADFTTPAYSYLSVTELSQYGALSSGRSGGKPGEQPEMPQDAHSLRRLKPAIPDGGFVCFYPMSKKREGEDNWYSLPLAGRQELMRAHGLTGRRFAGQVRQVISASSGFDDWEWGVTLFADDSLVFKKIVSEMRFDEVSARYALFGPFYVGIHAGPDDLISFLSLSVG
ncbi:MAG: hydrogen peroxide-dependent heme synthase [Thermaerobacterales bacterium]